MAFSLSWLADVLAAEQLKVAEVDGWKERGLGDMGQILGVLCHHTAGPRTGNMPSLRLVTQGRADLRGPLSQLGLGRDGTFYVIAAGRANHAGPGLWMGAEQGNLNFIGIEAENMGVPGDPWPEVQLDAFRRGVAALLRHTGLSAERCAGHKEFALPKGRKIDPSFDMVGFRQGVARILRGESAPPTLIPAVEPLAPPGTPPRPTLRRGSTDGAVRVLQTKLKLPVSGLFDAITEARVRVFQRDCHMVPDGIVGPKSWLQLDQLD